jgi:hypothetical protein
MTGFITEAELAEEHPTCIAVLSECTDADTKRRCKARSLWHVVLKDGSEHYLALRNRDEVVCLADSCDAKPLCPAVLRFAIRGARDRNPKLSLTKDY